MAAPAAKPPASPSVGAAGPLGMMPAWLVTLLRPVALVIMAACLALPLTQILTSLVPGQHQGLLLGAVLLAVLEAHFTQYLIRTRYISGADVWRLRAVEFGLYFVLIKLAQLALTGAPAGGWPHDPRGVIDFLFNLETVLTFTLAVGAALVTSDTLDDLDRVGEPAEIDKQYVPPLESLTDRFFFGGAAVLVLGGLARVRLQDLLNFERAPVTGLVATVLVYYVTGFLMLGQVRLALLASTWQQQGARVPPELGSRWVRYSLVFIGVAALIAFALPTGYTAGALGVLGSVIMLVFNIISALVVLVLGLAMLPLSWLLSLFHTERVVTSPDKPLTILPPAEVLNQPLPHWVEVLRTVIVWALVIGMVLYVISAYFRDRPELLRAVRDFGALRRLRQLWAAFRHRISGLASAVQAGPVAAWLRERLRPRAALPPMRPFRLSSATPREQVQYYYLSLLRRAGEYGFGRGPAQTPVEYHPVLTTNLPENTAEVQALTEAFIESRYSAHPVAPEQVQRVRAAWGGLRAALAKLKQQTRQERDHHG